MSENNENVVDEALPTDDAEGLAEAEAAVGAEVAEAEGLVEEKLDLEAEVADELELEQDAAEVQEDEEVPPTKKVPGIGDLIAVGILSLILGVLLCLPHFMGSSNDSNYDLSQGVAATVNGVSIGEKEITDYVAGLRSSLDVTDDAAWAEWMETAGYTPESIREAVVQYYISRELQIQAAAENDIEVSDEAVEEQISLLVEQFGSEEALEEALAEQGSSLDMYRENVRLGLQQQELAKKVVTDVESASDEEVLAILKMYYPDEVSEDATTLEGVDDELVAEIREALDSTAVEQGYSTWMQEYQEKATIEINDMPEGLSYDVDMSAVEQNATDDASEEAAGK